MGWVTRLRSVNDRGRREPSTVILEYSANALKQASQIVAGGGVIAFRTDTFYGLGANPFNSSAVKRIRDLKGREDDKPILVLISDAEQVNRLLEKRSTAFDELASRGWPGALTIIGEASLELPNELTAGTKTVGLRLPDDDKVRALVGACGGALTATSANPSGEFPARTAEDVSRYFGERIDLIVDGGKTEVDQPSTVVDASAGELKLVREGIIPWVQIQTTKQ